MPARPQTAVPRPRTDGFALVLALSIMAFCLVLLLSMTLLVQVEIRSAANVLEQQRAKEAARLALMVALGELQRHAGPDQRVTARADILGDGNYRPENRYWTGVWDTTDPNADPVWLVSGEAPDPGVANPETVIFAESYDANSDGDLSDPDDIPESQSPSTSISGTGVRFAWWIADNGIQAPITSIPGIDEEFDDPDLANYLDYNSRTLRNAGITYDPVFDFKALYDALPDAIQKVDRAASLDQVTSLVAALPLTERKAVQAEFIHALTLGNQFVLSNPLEGGLKRDLSYLKNLDADSVTLDELDDLFNDPDDLIRPEAVRLLNFRGNPVAKPSDEVLGMRIYENQAADAESAYQSFSLLPVITEFQLSGGIAAEDGDAPSSTMLSSELYFVHKLYVELWNPYTIPFRLGDPSMAADQGFSDMRFEITHLPTFSITNDTTGATVNGSIPDVSILWSEFASGKLMRPGMVYEQTFPLDSKGSNDTGVIQLPLGIALEGRRSDDYTGQFTFDSDSLEIQVYGIDSAGAEKEIYRFEIAGYPDYTIDYDPASRATWFKRVPSSESGQFGMNHDSLEIPGYAFGFRFKMLDEQESPGLIEDLSNWLSLHDVRSRSFEVDLATWDIDEAWTRTPPLPYDFKVNDGDTNPGFFDPSDSFIETDFFNYDSGGTGRLDRIARFIDLPTSEVADIGAFRGLKFRDIAANGVGNPWGGEVNRLYDRYFFSTLPAENITEWDGHTPLLNARLRSFGQIPDLDDPDNAESLLLANGFNINSTSSRAWEKVLDGRSHEAGSFELHYEKGIFSNPPDWTTVSEALQHTWFNHPQTAPFNLTERENDPNYEFVTRSNTPDYLDAFSIDSLDWHSDLQHPAFHQSIRELTDDDIRNLSAAIAGRLKAYTVTQGHPPLSVSEFLNAGIFQEAIDSVSTLNNRQMNQDRIPRYTPSSISQTTLMNLVGSFAFVRSDTFTIRAYAEVTDPVSQRLTARARCEMRVQRIPRSLADAPSFGRRFKIVEFTWLPGQIQIQP